MPDNISESARLCALSVLLLGSAGATPFISSPQLQCPRVPKPQALRPGMLCAEIRCDFFFPPLQIPLIHPFLQGLSHLSQTKAGIVSIFSLQLAVLSLHPPQRCDAARPHCATCVKYVTLAQSPCVRFDTSADNGMLRSAYPHRQDTRESFVRGFLIDLTVASLVVILRNLNVHMIPLRVYPWHPMPIP
jgi:hypothetical protein